MKKAGLIFLGILLFACSILPTSTEDGENETGAPEQEAETSSLPGGEDITAAPDAAASVEAVIPTIAFTEQGTAGELPAQPEMAENFYEYLLPIPLGERATIDDGSMKMTVRVVEAILAQDDVYTYTQLFPMVWEAPERMKYLVFLIGIEYLEGTSTERVDMLSNLDFTTISQGHILDSAEVSYHIDDNVSDLLLAPGESGQAFLAGLSYEGDDSPILKLDFGKQEYLFSLIPENAAPEPILVEGENLIPVDEEIIGTLENPVPLGATRSLYDSREGDFLNIRVEEVRRGSDAWRLLHDDWEFNEPAPDGYEYILPMVSIQRVDVAGNAETIESDFHIFSREENTPEVELWSCPMPCLAEAPLLYPGGTALGWVPLLVPQDEPVPLLTYGNQVYFSLMDENALSAGTVVFDEDAIGYDTIDSVTYYQTLRLPTVVYSLAFSPDHSILAAGCDNRKIYIYNTQDGSEIAVLEGHAGSVRALSFSLQDRIMASVGYNEEIVIWSTVDWTPVLQLSQTARGIFAQFLSDGTLVTGSQTGKLTVWDTVTGGIIREIDTPREQTAACGSALVQDFAVSSSGSMFGAALSCGFGTFWQPEGDSRVDIYNGSADSQQTPVSSSVVFSASQNMAAYGSVYYPDGYGFLIDVVDLNTGEVFTSVGQATVDIPAMTFSPNNDLLVAAIGKDMHVWWPGIQYWGEQDYTGLYEHSVQVTAIEFSRDSDLLATGDYSGRVLLWQVP